MNRVEIISPHGHTGTSVPAIMRETILALLPGILVYAFVISWGVLVQCILSVLFALACEAAVLRLRNMPVQSFLADGSVILTGLLFALTISPYTPWWINLCGIAFAVILIKHVYGGLGNNIFNPAMAGYVFVLLSFPAEMTVWPEAKSLQEPAIGLGACLQIIFTGSTPLADLDAISAATPLSYLQSQVSGMYMISEFIDEPLFGSMGGAGWEWVALAFMAGGIWLVFRRIIYWQVPAVLLGSLFVLSLVFYWWDVDVYASPVFHIVSVSTLLGAFFIATDPVSSATTARGRLIFAAGIALLTYAIRTWGAHPDGFAFAIILMNCAVPLLDHYTRPRVLGESLVD
ncbi:MAG: RnfABCDGE type electron transport complex subunit D [Thiotrichales bacterium]|nr:RnfABCDGE type electron transport complex subunit D [Thiotrichales bacterium]